MICISTFLLSCQNVPTTKDHSWVSRATMEAEWIQNGQPVEFEGELWFPADAIENLLDSEVYQVGEYKGVQIFVEFADVRPYNRLYTKFAKNKFRFFEKKEKDD